MRQIAILLLLMGIVQPAFCARRVTVEQLEQTLAAAHGLPDTDIALQLSSLELSERLSGPKRAMLSAELPGKKSKTALMATADASEFLDPPPDEIPQKAAPDDAGQTQMMSLAMDYLKKILPKLPDFYARRSTTAFEQVWTPKDEKRTGKRGALHSAGKFRATVYYREGKEVVHQEGAAEHGLIARGTFGPILRIVILDAARSNTTQWSRWEERPSGPMAVFRFQVPQKESHYKISESGESGTLNPTAYHGEIGIDPNSGTILKFVVEADPDLGSTMERSDIMVEYGMVDIGGKPYTCPVHSVSYSVGVLYVSTTLGVPTSWKGKATRMNDVVFDNYHVFRSEIRIVQ